MHASASRPGSFVNTDDLPEFYPTHKHTPEFWEHLGRVVATFGFLEEVLARAIFALTATRRYNASEIEEAYANWLPTLERALADPLSNLIDKYQKEARTHPDFVASDFDKLIDDLRKVAVYRNALCHGSWKVPDASGKSVPFFVNRQMQVFDTAIDVASLRSLQRHVAELACDVVSTITEMGWQFPGSTGPGQPVTM